MRAVIRRSRPATSTRVMGLDASLNSTGWAAMHGQQAVTGRITPGDKKGSSRLHHNLTQLRRVLDEYRPEVIVLEGYAMNAKGNRTFQIGEWGGVLRLEIWQRGITILTVSPSTLKYAAVGKAGPSIRKPEMMAACFDLFGERIKQNDQADAFLLMQFGQAHLHHLGPKAFVDRVLSPRDPKKPGTSSDPGMRK